MTNWPAILDAIDAGLTKSPPVFLTDLPLTPDPLPPALVGRAHETLRRMAEREATLQQEHAHLAHELSTLQASTPPTTSPPVPHFLDTKA